MDLKEIYNVVASGLRKEQLELLSVNFKDDDYSGKLQFIRDNWGKPAPELPYLLKGDIVISSFEAISELITILLKKGLLLKKNAFFNSKSKGPHYIISINRNDGHKVNLFCKKGVNKKEIVEELDRYRFKFNIS